MEFNRRLRGNRSVRACIESLELRRLLAGGTDRLVNDNAGATGTANFTQSEASVIVFGNTVVAAFDDSGSNAGGSNHFTGFSRSIDGGTTFTDGGTLPISTEGDAGDAMLARNEVTGRIYFSTLGFTTGNQVPVFRSDTNGASWQAPVNGTPGGSSEDSEWITVDNFTGTGQGNVYIASRRFGGSPGIYFFRSVDSGNTFTPTGGVLLVNSTTSPQGANVVVGPDHAVYVFWYGTTGSIFMRKSTDFGVTFAAQVTVVGSLPTTINGDLGLSGVRAGTTTPGGFRSNSFPHAAVNPANGNIYVTYNDNGTGADKSDVFLVQSTNGGANWSVPTKINDDATTTDQWQPTIAVTPEGAALGIFYYSRQEDPSGNNLYRFYSRLATVSGATLNFTASSPVSDVASLPEFGRDAVINSVYMGDKNTITATNVAFHVVWADNRSDLTGGAGRKDPNVYYDKVPVPVSGATWTGLAGNSLWTDPANWSSGAVPGASQDVLIPAGFSDIFLPSGSTLSVKTLDARSPLVISGTLTIAGTNNVVKANSLTFGGTGRLDIGSNDLILDYAGVSPLNTLSGYITRARAGGTWTGAGLTSTAAKNAVPKNTTLGVLEATEFKSLYGPAALFDGQTIDTTALLVKYTYYGDTDFNGVVNFDDYSHTDAGFNLHKSGWLNGDFEGNGVVDFDDYALIDLAFNTQGAALGLALPPRQHGAPAKFARPL